MSNLVTVAKKRGRPKKDIQWDGAARQRFARGKAHSAFLIESCPEKSKQLLAEMSTSNLIALLPKLISVKHKYALENVCTELVKRVNQ